MLIGFAKHDKRPTAFSFLALLPASQKKIDFSIVYRGVWQNQENHNPKTIERQAAGAVGRLKNSTKALSACWACG